MDANLGIGSIGGARELFNSPKTLGKKEVVESGAAPVNDQFSQDPKDKEISELKTKFSELKKNAIKAATWTAISMGTFLLGCCAVMGGSPLIAAGLIVGGMVTSAIGKSAYKKVYQAE
jgi:hypothetical protein